MNEKKKKSSKDSENGFCEEERNSYILESLLGWSDLVFISL